MFRRFIAWLLNKVNPAPPEMKEPEVEYVPFDLMDPYIAGLIREWLDGPKQSPDDNYEMDEWQ